MYFTLSNDYMKLISISSFFFFLLLLLFSQYRRCSVHLKNLIIVHEREYFKRKRKDIRIICSLNAKQWR
jgi:hypothetical protein